MYANTGSLSVRHLLGVKDLTTDDYDIIFSTTDNSKAQLDAPVLLKSPVLREITVCNLFFENSTRTRISFELAEKRLSADILNFSASTSSVSKGETLLDTVKNILAMKVDVLVIRHPKPGAPHFISRRVKARVVNAGDGAHEHPTQALLDCYSLKQKFGELKGLNVAIVGDILHSRVALSNIFALKKLGANVKVCGPPTLIPKYIDTLGVGVEYDFDKLLQWADAANMLRIQQERFNTRYFPSQREYARYFGLDRARLEKANRPITILHPGPINRGVEITSEVADNEQAIILDQVQNGVAIRMAVLYLLAGTKSY